MTMLMVKVNEASLHAGREDAATGKYKTRNIYSLSLSLSLTPSEYNPLILLSCPAHSISACTDLPQCPNH